MGRDVIMGLNMVIHGGDGSVTIDGLPASGTLRMTRIEKVWEFFRCFEGLNLEVLPGCVEVSEIRWIVDGCRVQAGTSPKFYHCIRLNKGSGPVFRRNYRIEETKKQFVVEKVKELLKQVVIEESLSGWNSPLAVVKKGDSFRPCLDFRGVNDLTELEMCPPPNVDEAIDALSKSRFFTQQDLKDGYNQVYPEASSREITAFTTPEGRFQYVWMPFGSKNAQATPQSTMYVVLGRYIGSMVVVYMDDIVIFSRTEEEHRRDVEEVINTITLAGLVLNMSKCKYRQRSISFLGFIIGGDRVSINKDRFKVLCEEIKVKTAKQLQRALVFGVFQEIYCEFFQQGVEVV